MAVSTCTWPHHSSESCLLSSTSTSRLVHYHYGFHCQICNRVILRVLYQASAKIARYYSYNTSYDYENHFSCFPSSSLCLAFFLPSLPKLLTWDSETNFVGACKMNWVTPLGTYSFIPTNLEIAELFCSWPHHSWHALSWDRLHIQYIMIYTTGLLLHY